MALDLYPEIKSLVYDVLEIPIIELCSEHRIAVHWVILDHFLPNKRTRRLTPMRKRVKPHKSLLCNGLGCL